MANSLNKYMDDNPRLIQTNGEMDCHKKYSNILKSKESRNKDTPIPLCNAILLLSPWDPHVCLCVYTDSWAPNGWDTEPKMNLKLKLNEAEGIFFQSFLELKKTTN